MDRRYAAARAATLMLIATVGLTVYAAEATWALWRDLLGEAQTKLLTAVDEAFHAPRA